MRKSHVAARFYCRRLMKLGECAALPYACHQTLANSATSLIVTILIEALHVQLIAWRRFAGGEGDGCG